VSARPIDSFRRITAALDLPPHSIAWSDQIQQVITDYYAALESPLPWSEEQVEVAAATVVMFHQLADAIAGGNIDSTRNLLCTFLGSIPEKAS
jgi:hypothetical protein